MAELQLDKQEGGENRIWSSVSEVLCAANAIRIHTADNFESLASQ
jgi:hypothetical protein